MPIQISIELWQTDLFSWKNIEGKGTNLPDRPKYVRNDKKVYIKALDIARQLLLLLD